MGACTVRLLWIACLTTVAFSAVSSKADQLLSLTELSTSTAYDVCMACGKADCAQESFRLFPRAGSGWDIVDCRTACSDDNQEQFNESCELVDARAELPCFKAVSNQSLLNFPVSKAVKGVLGLKNGVETKVMYSIDSGNYLDFTAKAKLEKPWLYKVGHPSSCSMILSAILKNHVELPNGIPKGFLFYSPPNHKGTFLQFLPVGGANAPTKSTCVFVGDQGSLREEGRLSVSWEGLDGVVSGNYQCSVPEKEQTLLATVKAGAETTSTTHKTADITWESRATMVDCSTSLISAVLVGLIALFYQN